MILDRRVWSMFAGGLLAAMTPTSPSFAGQAALEGPKLVVWLVIDQGRGDLPQRLGDTLEPQGLGRFSEEGVNFTDAHFHHLSTWTAAGHATLSTGSYPNRHGIFANRWHVDGVGISSIQAPEKGGPPGPYHLRAPTLGDALHLASPKSQVVSISLKDRAAIFMGGKGSDGSYWLNTKSGDFTSLTGDIPPWLAEFNAASPADAAFGSTWDHALPQAMLDAEAPIDDCPGESGGLGLGRTFPRVINGGLDAPGPNYYKALLRSPPGTSLLLDAALAAVAGENLGQDEHPDILFVSVSTTDYVGHSFGSQSQEWLEVVAHLDRALVPFFESLEAQVGKGNLGLVLSADHGAPPVPECMPEAVPHGRVWHEDVLQAVEGALEPFKATGQASVAGFADPGLWLDLGPEVDATAARAAVSKALLALPGIMALCDTRDPSGPYAEACRLSIVPGREPDFMLIAEPYYVFSRAKYGSTGTTHGGPHHYDSHVVMGLWGPGLEEGPRHGRADIAQLAPTVAAWLRIPPPAAAEGPALDVFKEEKKRGFWRR